MSQNTDFRAASFPTTRWSRLLVDPAADSAAARAAFETLARRYWPPIAAAIPARRAKSDDAPRAAAQEHSAAAPGLPAETDTTRT